MALNWELLVCGLRGHTTYEPDDRSLRARLHSKTRDGEAWRCLRCGTFVVGDPQGSGPAENAPAVARGPVLRDQVIMRALAVERLLRALVFLALGSGLIAVRHSGGSLKQRFDAELPMLAPIADQIGVDLDSSKLVQNVDRALGLSSSTIVLMGAALIGYCVIELVEAYGLWRGQRWGEYFAVIATGIFIPLEIYEITEKVTVIRAGALTINIAAVIWLIWRKRLFGVNGGTPAYEAEHHADSLLTVEEAAEVT